MHCGRPLVRESAEYCLECQRKKYVLTANLAGSAKNPYYKSNSNIFQGKALFVYGGKLKQMMYRFKYGNRRVYAEFFARKAFEKYGDWIKQKQIDVIVPVPMYQKKKKIRGYNQAEVFAEALARVLDIPVERNLVCRIRDTIPQKGLNDMERKNNLKNAFQIEKSIVQYRHILVVDDIYTTGSTAEAVAEELIKTGVSRVYMMNICIGKDM